MASHAIYARGRVFGGILTDGAHTAVCRVLRRKRASRTAGTSRNAGRIRIPARRTPHAFRRIHGCRKRACGTCKTPGCISRRKGAGLTRIARNQPRHVRERTRRTPRALCGIGHRRKRAGVTRNAQRRIKAKGTRRTCLSINGRKDHEQYKQQRRHRLYTSTDNLTIIPAERQIRQSRRPAYPAPTPRLDSQTSPQSVRAAEAANTCSGTLSQTDREHPRSVL